VARLLRRPYQEVLFRILAGAEQQGLTLLALAELMQEQGRLPVWLLRQQQKIAAAAVAAAEHLSHPAQAAPASSFSNTKFRQLQSSHLNPRKTG
jgi:hypothetical protein